MKLDEKRTLLMKVCDPYVEGIEKPWRHIELGLHEMCHIALLGIPFDADAPNQVSDFFDNCIERNPIIALVEEAHCFAVEKLVVRNLGLGKYIEIDRDIRKVWENGTAGPVLPLPWFQSIIRRSGRQNTTSGAARSVLYYIYSQTGIVATRMP